MLHFGYLRIGSGLRVLEGGDRLDVEPESAFLFAKISTPPIIEPSLIDRDTKLLYKLLMVFAFLLHGQGWKMIWP